MINKKIDLLQMPSIGQIYDIHFYMELISDKINEIINHLNKIQDTSSYDVLYSENGVMKVTDKEGNVHIVKG